jgi:chemotaxis protein CheD
VLPVAKNRRYKPTVGALNRKAAEETLAEEGLIVCASDVGGIRGRRIHFHTGTGEVLLYRLSTVGDRAHERRSHPRPDDRSPRRTREITQ